MPFQLNGKIVTTLTDLDQQLQARDFIFTSVPEIAVKKARADLPALTACVTSEQGVYVNLDDRPSNARGEATAEEENHFHLCAYEIGDGITLYAYNSFGERILFVSSYAPTIEELEELIVPIQHPGDLNWIITGGSAGCFHEATNTALKRNLSTTLRQLFLLTRMHPEVGVNIVGTKVLEQNTVTEKNCALFATARLYHRLNSLAQQYCKRPLQLPFPLSFDTPGDNFKSSLPGEKALLTRGLELVLTANTHLNIPYKYFPAIGATSLDDYFETLAKKLFTSQGLRRFKDMVADRGWVLMNDIVIDCRTHEINLVNRISPDQIPGYAYGASLKILNFHPEEQRIVVYKANPNKRFAPLATSQRFYEYLLSLIGKLRDATKLELDYVIADSPVFQDSNNDTSFWQLEADSQERRRTELAIQQQILLEAWHNGIVVNSYSYHFLLSILIYFKDHPQEYKPKSGLPYHHFFEHTNNQAEFCIAAIEGWVQHANININTYDDSQVYIYADSPEEFEEVTLQLDKHHLDYKIEQESACDGYFICLTVDIVCRALRNQLSEVEIHKAAALCPE